MNQPSGTRTAILIYLLLVLMFLYSKPAFIFDESGNLKEFGTGQSKTLVPLWSIFGIFAVLSYVIFA